MPPLNRIRTPSKVQLQTLTEKIETDPRHHLAGSFLPQTPFGAQTPGRDASFRSQPLKSLPWWLKWAVDPVEAMKVLLIPVVLYCNWEIVRLFTRIKFNPFGSLFLLSHPVHDSSPDDPLYQKGWCDIPFIIYHLFWFSFLRQIVVRIFKRAGFYFGLRSVAKLERFSEQGYAMVYFAIYGLWGVWIMKTCPTWWFRTEYYWIDYPHWAMKPALKRYYLTQFSHWLYELLVMVLGVEKPRKDFFELVIHHAVTLWLIFWSYLVNLTFIGNGVFVSMDIPDVFLAFSKLLNYLQYDRAKNVSFLVFFGVWTYFRHYLNIVILHSVWIHFDLIPESARQWRWREGAWMVWWMRYQIWAPIFALQLINLFWYYLMWRILYRAVAGDGASDVRSDDEDEGEDAPSKQDN